MTSQQSSNSLLVDPSIIQISSTDSSNTTNPNLLHNPAPSSLEPGNALSKLLDSAIAKAAKESTPELEPRSNSNSPSASISSKSSRKKHVYSIEFLLKLKGSPYVKDYKDSNKLPDKSFWRSKIKPQSGNVNITKEYKHHKKNSSYTKKHQNETWERKQTGFNKSNDLDSLSTDKISQLLGEAPDELEPEWDSIDLHDDLKMNMGQTVEDFEKWKSHMKLEERRKNGEIIDESSILNDSFSNSLAAEIAGNEVDNFFSFVKPKSSDNASSNKSSFSNNQPTPVLSTSEISNKSSRFSSFFNTPANENPPSVPESSPAPVSRQPSTASEQPSNHFSRFFSGNTPTSQNPSSIPSQVPSVPISNTGQPTQSQSKAQQQNKSQMPTPKNSDGTITNDSFFMSLLNKKDPNIAPDNSLSNFLGQPKMPTIPSPHSQNVQASQPQMQHPQPIINPKQQQPQPQFQQQQQPQSRPTQSQPIQQQNSQQVPPWMKQFQNGVLPPPPHLQYNPNITAPPPPNMFPPGFVPPPGMQVPPQFANGNRNRPFPPPPPYMGFPPGMPPPHLQPQQSQHQQQFEQQNRR